MYGLQNANSDYDLKLFMFVSQSVKLCLKEQKLKSIFGVFSFSIMNDISNTNYRIAYLWWYMDREHSQKYLQPLQVIITLELFKLGRSSSTGPFCPE